MTLLDTNIVLYHLQGKLRDPLPTSDVHVSVISEIELLGFPGIKLDEETRIRAFLSSLQLVDLDAAVKANTIQLRQSTRLRIPDAIIVASAAVLGAELITNDLDIHRVQAVTCRTAALK